MRRIFLACLLLVGIFAGTLSGFAQAPDSSTDKHADTSADKTADPLDSLTLTTFSLAPAAPPASSSQVSRTSLESIAPGRLVVVYRSGAVPKDAAAIAARAGVRIVRHLPLFGLSSVQVSGDSEAAIAALLAQPEVATVLHDRYVSAHALEVLPAAAVPKAAGDSQKAGVSSALSTPPPPFTPPVAVIAHPATVPESDSYYNSPQGWAVVQSGGYGENVPGGPASGPWNTSLGSGVRIAILDSGVDALHPDIAPNLVLNLSEVNQSLDGGIPSACDDGTPQDQMGHGTWTASLAAAAMGPNTGRTIGVAPQASLLNIKVVERLIGAIGDTTAQQCESGSAGGLLTWVLQGIQDAVANKADVISLSLGTLIDVTTGDGAGWQAQMDSVSYAAQQAGAVIVAAAGNNGVDLSSGQYIELPAQAQGVLPVVASTNPACMEQLTSNPVCMAGPVTRPYYSNYGASLNAIAAPGGSYPGGPDTGVSGFVRGACSNGLPGTTDGPPGNPGQSFGCFNLGHTAYMQAIGTSASAPLVAGAAAILHATHPGWTAAQIVSALQNSATKNPEMVEPELNLPAALALQ